MQSGPVTGKVGGAPQVMKNRAEHAVRVRSGEDAKLSVTFCADPMPKPQWHLGDRGSSSSDGNGGLHNIILASGTQHGRFLAEQLVRSADGRENCYVSALRINGAHSDDSKAYELRLENEHGQDSHVIKLVVRSKS